MAAAPRAARSRRAAWSRRAPLVAASAVALVVVGPLLRPGFTLVYDMVFVPHLRLSRELLGVAPGFPRAVPTDLLVALGSFPLASGAVVQKLAQLFVFGGATLGMARLVPVGGPVSRIGAGLLYAWNPFTYERLLLGQWALLLGYALLPWALSAAIAFRRRAPGSAWRLVLALAALTAASPYTGIIGGVATLAVASWPGSDGGGRRGVRDAALIVAAAAVVSLPWLVPALLHTGGPDDARLAVSVFRARSDSPLGTVGSLLSLGGLWRTDLAPPGRGTIAWIPAFALIAWVAVVGWRRLAAAWPAGARRGLGLAAVVGVVLAAGPAIPGLRDAVSWAADHLPGGGFLRDSQKFVIPYAAALAVGFGVGLDALLEAMAARRADARVRRVAAMAIAVLPLALAPTLAFAAWGRLHTASYPPSWARAETVMSADPTPGAVLVLPWHAYLPFSWNHDQTVHQPAPLYFSRHALVATDLELGGGVRLPGEDPWSRLAGRALGNGRPLRQSLPLLGARYVLLFHEVDWRDAVPLTAGLSPVLQTDDLTLYRGPVPGPPPVFSVPALAPVVAGDVAAVALVAIAGVQAWRARRWRGKGLY